MNGESGELPIESDPQEVGSANGSATETGMASILSSFLSKFEHTTDRLIRSLESPRPSSANENDSNEHISHASPPPLPFIGASSRPDGYNPMSGSRANQLTADQPFAPELHVIDRHQRRTPGYGSFHGERSPESRQNTIYHGAPSSKLPTYDGTEEVDVFLTPFERMADRHSWGEQEKVDRLYQCLKGKAMRFVCSLPGEVSQNYFALRGNLTNRFGDRDPPTTARLKLMELQQKGDNNEEFAEEISRLVSKAYPGVGQEMQDQLVAEAFLRGYKKPKIAYEVLNRNPLNLNDAIELVTRLEHNYRATVGREESSCRERTRRVSWADPIDSEDDVYSAQRVQTPTYVTVQQLDARITKLENMFTKFCNTVEAKFKTQQETPEPPQVPQIFKCYGCGNTGHFRKDCPVRSRSPSPTPKTINPTLAPTNPSSTVKVTRLGSPYKSIVVPVLVNGLFASAVVDTGADATVVSTRFAQEAGLDLSGTQTCKLLNAESGAEMMALGGVTATLRVADKEWQSNVFVAPIRDQVLLGMDFLSENDVIVLAKQGDLLIEGLLLSGQASDAATSAFSRATLVDDVTIPAESDKIIEPTDDKIMVFDPGSFIWEVYIDSIIVKTKPEIPVRILNLERKLLQHDKCTHLGKLVWSRPEGTSAIQTHTVTVPCLPGHIHERFAISYRTLPGRFQHRIRAECETTNHEPLLNQASKHLNESSESLQLAQPGNYEERDRQRMTDPRKKEQLKSKPEKQIADPEMNPLRIPAGDSKTTYRREAADTGKVPRRNVPCDQVCPLSEDQIPRTRCGRPVTCP